MPILFIAVRGSAFCILTVAPLLLDIFDKALRGNAIPAVLLTGYAVLGVEIMECV